MATVFNPRLVDIVLPDRTVVPPGASVTCANADLVTPDTWAWLNTAAAAGDLTYELDPPPPADAVDAEPMPPPESMAAKPAEPEIPAPATAGTKVLKG